MKKVFLILGLAAALSTAAVSAHAAPASAINAVNRQGGGAVSQGAELSMIQLQSVVSRRQQELQMTTNMMNSGCIKCIVQNIK
jgi:hypothetical protein